MRPPELYEVGIVTENKHGVISVNINLSSTVSWRDTPLCTEVDGQLVLMDISSGKFFGLDTVAMSIWERIEYPVSVTDLCSGCIADFEGQPAVIEADVLRLLAYLAKFGLIVVTD